MSNDGAARYLSMQKDFYEDHAALSRYDQDKKQDVVVGSYEDHNNWPDYDRFLMRYVDHSFKDKRVLDFACGPGRNLIKYAHLFKTLDGADIGAKNLENAVQNLAHHGLAVPKLYLTNGADLGDAPDNSYDLIFSTIAMQHICVHQIRFQIFAHMYRALRKLGRISIQMGFGNRANAVGYYDNFYDALTTNSGSDTMIHDPDDVENDLRRIGFGNFEYWVRPVGPGDRHAHWIFFTATK
jgi:ubiquinone/menaquinone biosynthesis C-methylase UbiE